jgi:2'-5' RNA ligase
MYTRFLPDFKPGMCSKKRQTFDLTFEGSGFFGSRMAVRTIWAGTKPSTELHQLFTQVIESTGFLRLEQQARFSPHLTLARVSDWVSKEENVLIAKNLSSQESQTFGITQVASFELIESSLNPSGPVYKSVHIFQLR